MASAIIVQSTVLFSGILLMPLAYLAGISGFCMKNPDLVGELTLGLLSDYGLCSYIHLDAIPLAVTIVAVVHVVFTLETLRYKLSRAGLAYKILYKTLLLASMALGVHIVAVALLLYL